MAWRNEHGEIGFTAGARKRCRDIMFLTLRRFDAEDQHVFGHPPLFPGQIGANAKGETFFAEQYVAAIAGAHGNDGIILGEVCDKSSFRADIEERMHAPIPFRPGALAEPFQRDLTHTRHDAHAENDVDRVG